MSDETNKTAIAACPCCGGCHRAYPVAGQRLVFSMLCPGCSRSGCHPRGACPRCDAPEVQR